MNRRRFMTAIFLASGLACHTLYQASVMDPIMGALMKWRRRKEVPLKVGDIHFVKMNTVIKLPPNPKDGDVVYLEITNQTLKVPSIVKSDSASILGDDDDLVLDTFSNIRLTYEVKTNNWSLA